jgi:hypothetical protein
MVFARYTGLCLLFLLIIPSLLLSDSQKVTLSYYKGIISIYRNKTAITPEIDMNLYEGDSLSTGANSTLEITYENGSVSSLEPHSVIVIKLAEKDEGKLKTRIKAWLGKVFCKIQKLKDGENFEVYTPTAVASVRGTVFEASVSETQETSFNVLAGEVFAKSLVEGAKTYLLKETFKYQVGRDGMVDVRKLTQQELNELKNRASSYIRNFIEESNEEIKEDLRKKAKKGCLGLI